jgi:hypothetical protein
LVKYLSLATGRGIARYGPTGGGRADDRDLGTWDTVAAAFDLNDLRGQGANTD